MTFANRLLTTALAVLLLAFNGCKKPDDSTATGASDGKAKKKLAYITNGIDPFWVNAAAGVRKAEEEFNVECKVHMPPNGIDDQKRMIETVLAQGIDGIAISPIAAADQVGLINEACERTHVITHDSDAPDSKRLCFVGMDNYKAGRAAGKLVKEALPDGGEVMIFVGRLEQLNAKQRRQGVIDELLDRPVQSLDSITYDLPPGKALKGPKYTVLDTRTDGFDYARAKGNAEDAISANPNLGCMVGLFAYNTPNCLAAVKEAGKLDKIKLVSFDEQDAVLQGIIDGEVHGTISQQPYEYGYQSVRILAGLARGDRSVLPPDGFQEVGIIEVRKDNAQSFWENLKKLRGGG